MASSANARIAKNTGLLYFRLLFLTAINLYAVRITLEALGVIDYGVYNTIASVVGSLSVLNGAMTSATQRFLSFHLGKEDYLAYSKSFSMLLLGFVILAVALMIIGEGVGWYFLDGRLRIPPDRMYAAEWILQTSLLTFGINLAIIPYAAQIVANERMGAFALFSIVDGVLKLAVVFILISSHGDRLILYGVLILAETVGLLLMHIFYCHRHFRYCRYIWEWNKKLFRELTGYTGWNLLGSTSAMLATQGQNILLNIFFGPVINAAKAIGDRINNVIHGFSTNLYMAVSPQIIKSYAAGDYQRTFSLVMNSSKFGFLMLFMIAFPLICNMRGWLLLWLGPDSHSEDMTQFACWMLIYSLVVSLEQPISRLIQATGNIKWYQICVGAITLMFIPVAALVLWLGGSAIMTVVVLTCIMALAQVVRLIIARRQVGFACRPYLMKVILPLAGVALWAIPCYFLFSSYLASERLMPLIGGTLLCGLFELTLIWFTALSSHERGLALGFVRKKLRKGKKETE